MDTSRIATFDIETELIPEIGLKGIKKIYCINVKINDEPVKRFTYLYHPTSSGNLQSAVNLINSCDFCVGHNILGFDIPVIENLVGEITAYPLDTLLIAKLMFSKDRMLSIDYGIKDFPKALIGSFSLKAFGYRLGDYKIQFEEFDKMTDSMLEYCDQDVNLTYRLFKSLQTQGLPESQCIELEHQVKCIIQDQEDYGFYFDLEKAQTLSNNLKFKKLSLSMKLKKVFKPMFLPDGPVKQTNKLIKRKQYIPNPNFKGW